MRFKYGPSLPMAKYLHRILQPQVFHAIIVIHLVTRFDNNNRQYTPLGLCIQRNNKNGRYNVGKY